MDILVAQTLCLCGLFLSMVGFTLLPMKIIPNDDGDGVSSRSSSSNNFLSSKYETFVSLANCLSAGVFLATFFIGLLPEVREQMTGILEEAGLTTTLPPTELTVVLGFFLAMFVEQIALSVKSGSHGHSHHSGAHNSIRSCEEDDEENDITVESLGTTVTVTPVSDWPSSTDPSLVQKPLERSATTNNHHGHSHDVEALLDPSASGGVRFGILLLSLGVHSLFEGMALGLQEEIHTLINLFVGVWIHECLIAFALGFSMIRVRLTTCRFIQIAVLFSSLIPAGQILGIVIGVSRSYTSRVLNTFLQAIAAGTFIQVTFLDIIPEGLGTNGGGNDNKLLKVFLIFLGFLSIVIVTFFVQMQHAH